MTVDYRAIVTEIRFRMVNLMQQYNNVVQKVALDPRRNSEVYFPVTVGDLCEEWSFADFAIVESILREQLNAPTTCQVIVGWSFTEGVTLQLYLTLHGDIPEWWAQEVPAQFKYLIPSHEERDQYWLDEKNHTPEQVMHMMGIITDSEVWAMRASRESLRAQYKRKKATAESAKKVASTTLNLEPIIAKHTMIGVDAVYTQSYQTAPWELPKHEWKFRPNLPQTLKVLPEFEAMVRHTEEAIQRARKEPSVSADDFSDCIVNFDKPEEPKCVEIPITITKEDILRFKPPAIHWLEPKDLRPEYTRRQFEVAHGWLTKIGRTFQERHDKGERIRPSGMNFDSVPFPGKQNPEIEIPVLAIFHQFIGIPLDNLTYDDDHGTRVHITAEYRYEWLSAYFRIACRKSLESSLRAGPITLANGEMRCEHCREEFLRHPYYLDVLSNSGLPYLQVACNGALLKL